MRPRLCQPLSTATSKQKPEHSAAVMLDHVRCRRRWSLLPLLFYFRVAQWVRSASTGREKNLGNINILLFCTHLVLKHTMVDTRASGALAIEDTYKYDPTVHSAES